MLQLAEVSTSILELVTQPHRLEMHLEGRTRPLIYFPDMLMHVETDFVEALFSGVAFEDAALAWRPYQARCGTTRILVEVKAKQDKRANDPDYQAKLSLAKSVYTSVGLHFVVLEEETDFSRHLPEAVQDVFFNRDTEIRPSDIATVARILSPNGALGSYGHIQGALGGGHVGPAKLNALHVRRVVSIDISKPLHDAAPVRLIGRSS